jgi:uncharacterized protein (DUF58 family)
VNGEAAGRVDWRRSARDDRLYVREREWEAPHAIWLWVDRSASMAFASDLADAPKIERALVIGLALADTLVEGGERVGLMGRTRPSATRRIIETVATSYGLPGPDQDDDLPPDARLGRLDEVLLIGDFLVPLDELVRRVETLSAGGARGHLLMVVDPVEETFPFAGQAILHDLEAGLSLRIGDAASWGEAYRTRIGAHRAAIADFCRRRGWSLTIHHTDRPASEAALRVLTLVAGAGRAGTGA